MDLARTRKRAEWEITLGQLTVAATLFARLVTVYLQLRVAGSLNPVDFGLAVLKSGILILALVFYRRSVWPALLMLTLWPIGFLYAWLGAPHASLPVLAVGLLVGVGFFIGERGVRSLRHVRALESSPTVAA